MQTRSSIFALFGGIRPMARKLGEPTSNVAAWKRVGRIPAEKQPRVLAIALELGLPVTPELVIFPSGDVPETVARALGQTGLPSSRPHPCGSAAFIGVDQAAHRRYGNRAGAFSPTAAVPA